MINWLLFPRRSIHFADSGFAPFSALLWRFPACRWCPRLAGPVCFLADVRGPSRGRTSVRGALPKSSLPGANKGSSARVPGGVLCAVGPSDPVSVALFHHPRRRGDRLAPLFAPHRRCCGEPREPRRRATFLATVCAAAPWADGGDGRHAVGPPRGTRRDA